MQAMILGSLDTNSNVDENSAVDLNNGGMCTASSVLSKEVSEARREAERQRKVEVTALIRNAYLEKAKQFHPDRQKQRHRHKRNSSNNSNSNNNNSNGKSKSNKIIGEEEEEEEEEEKRAAESFLAIQRAYEHLSVHGGRGQQHNERHDLNAMIDSLSHATTLRSQSMIVSMADGGEKEGEPSCTIADKTREGKKLNAHTDAKGSHNEEISPQKEESTEDKEKEKEGEGSALLFFKARLLAALLDYNSGSGGMPASSLRKKWNEIWPEHAFPSSDCMHAILDQLDLEQEQQELSSPPNTVPNRHRSRRRNKCKKIKVLSFLKTVAWDCCRVEDSQPGVEPVLFAIQTQTQQTHT